jgi:hypothetical protein
MLAALGFKAGSSSRRHFNSTEQNLTSATSCWCAARFMPVSLYLCVQLEQQAAMQAASAVQLQEQRLDRAALVGACSSCGAEVSAMLDEALQDTPDHVLQSLSQQALRMRYDWLVSLPKWQDLFFDLAPQLHSSQLLPELPPELLDRCRFDLTSMFLCGKVLTRQVQREQVGSVKWLSYQAQQQKVFRWQRVIQAVLAEWGTQMDKYNMSMHDMFEWMDGSSQPQRRANQ